MRTVAVLPRVSFSCSLVQVWAQPFPLETTAPKAAATARRESRSADSQC
jgi:hypothetical protein